MKYSVGDLAIDTGRQVVSRGADTIALPKLSYDLLLALVRAAPNLVSLDELMRLVWPGIVVSPETVSQRVKLLRDALGDDPREPRYIAGLRGRGYQMIAAVEHLDAQPGASAANAASAASAAVHPPARRSLLRPNRILPTVVLAVVAVASVLFLADRFWWRTPITRENPAAAAVNLPGIPEKSVAVLPFIDMSENKDQGYFADGMSEELIDNLARVPGLRVPARTSSFYFKGKQATVADIAKALGVAHLLEGSVRKSGDMLRVTAQLIRADTGYHIWSETFDRTMTDIFKVQDEIARAVVSGLKISLTRPETSKSALTANSAAYSLYLKARAISQGNQVADYDVATKYVEQALALDPNFAAAWHLLSGLLIQKLQIDPLPRAASCARAKSSVDEAIRLAPMWPDGYRGKGAVLAVCDWNWRDAEAEYKKAFELDPLNARTLLSYSTVAWEMRRPRLALELAQKAVAQDPLDAHTYWGLALAQGAAGDLQGAEASWRKLIEFDPVRAGPHALLSNALLAEGNASAALEEIEREPDEQFRQMNYPFIYEALGRTREATEAIATFEKNYGMQDPVTIGEFYACRKQLDVAVTWLERGIALHRSLTDVPNRQACYKNLERDPRYQAMLRKMDIPMQPNG